jgi:predicted CXXCH cytochrome family protein
MTPIAAGAPRWQSVLVVALLLALPATCIGRAQDLPPELEECLECHSEEGFTMTFEDGSKIDLQVDGEAFLGSVHGSELFCTDCHEAYDEDHRFDSWASRREYVLASYDLCKSCHFDTYSRTLESVHYEHLAQGSNEIPVCSDCHGAHEIESPLERHALMSSRCGSCHDEVYAKYEESAHGKALSTDRQDLPGCAQCHTAHTIELPGSTKFHLASPQLCLNCHGDKEMMERHGLATTIGETYLADFHGVSATLADPEEVAPDEVVVVCVDCHGYHDITSTEQLGDEAMTARVEAVCAECHEGSETKFPAAWLSHYPPSWNHAPLVYLVTIAYRIFIPFMIIGLSLQILLHLYRVGIRR